jgi:hypothetical protein
MLEAIFPAPQAPRASQDLVKRLALERFTLAKQSHRSTNELRRCRSLARGGGV